MAQKKPPQPKGVVSKPVGYRSGDYGGANSRSKLTTGGKRGSKLRGGQTTNRPMKGYGLP